MHQSCVMTSVPGESCDKTPAPDSCGRAPMTALSCMCQHRDRPGTALSCMCQHRDQPVTALACMCQHRDLTALSCMCQHRDQEVTALAFLCQHRDLTALSCMCQHRDLTLLVLHVSTQRSTRFEDTFALCVNAIVRQHARTKACVRSTTIELYIRQCQACTRK
jgi:hypothetical protein